MRIKNIATHRFVAIHPARTRTVSRGSGRRLRALPEARQAAIPRTATTTPTSTHEIEFAGKQWAGALTATTEVSSWHLETVAKYEAQQAARQKVPAPDDGTEYGGLSDKDDFGRGVTYEQYQRALLHTRILDLSKIPDDEVIVAFIGAAEGFPRPNGSKLIYHHGRAWSVLTWTDLFGASIKESGMTWTTNGHLLMPLRQIADELVPVVRDAIMASPRVVGKLV